MNRKIKRYISILLSVATVFASLSVTVLANGETVENQEFDLLGVLSAKYPGLFQAEPGMREELPTEPTSFPQITTFRNIFSVG